MTSLEKVIKDLEFENENLIRQIKDEIEAIDCIQKDVREKAAENEKMEDVIHNMDKETKQLHDHFKQNKDIAESLKSATSLLQRHSEDLKNTLKLKVQDIQQERMKHEQTIQVYTDKWSRYETEYEKHPLAKVIRKLKLDVADLDAEEIQLGERKNNLEVMITEFDVKKGISEEEKKEAIAMIIEFALVKVSTKQLEDNIQLLVKKQKELCIDTGRINKECEMLEAEIEKKKKDELHSQAILEQDVHDSSSSQIGHPNISLPPESMQQLNRPAQSNSDAIPLSDSKISPFPLFQKKISQQLQLPKIPNLPKFKNFQMKPLPSNNQTKPEEISMNQRLQISSDPIQPCKVNVLPEALQPVVYDVPIGVSVKEFLGNVRDDDNEGGDAAPSVSIPQKSPKSPFNFSPGQHAKYLAQLKRSPGDSFFRVGRPMFQAKNEQNDTGTKEVNENKFCFQQQFINCEENKYTEDCQMDNVASEQLPIGKERSDVVIQDEVTSMGTVTQFNEEMVPTSESYPANVEMTSENDKPMEGVETSITEANVSCSIGNFSLSKSSNHNDVSPEFSFDTGDSMVSPSESNFNFDPSGNFTSPEAGTEFNFINPADATSPEGSADFNIFKMASYDEPHSVFNFPASSDEQNSIQPSSFNIGAMSNSAANDGFDFSFEGVASPENNNESNFAFSF